MYNYKRCMYVYNQLLDIICLAVQSREQAQYNFNCNRCDLAVAVAFLYLDRSLSNADWCRLSIAYRSEADRGSCAWCLLYYNSYNLQYFLSNILFKTEDSVMWFTVLVFKQSCWCEYWYFTLFREKHIK